MLKNISLFSRHTHCYIGIAIGIVTLALFALVLILALLYINYLLPGFDPGAGPLGHGIEKPTI